jgi:coproporphyrinogen III oxidase-like Fe-S oxidoreductase
LGGAETLEYNGTGGGCCRVPRRARLACRAVGWATLRVGERFFRSLTRMRVEPGEHVRVLRGLEGVYALYTHMPFCMPPLCRFCCFVRYPFNARRYSEYMKALHRELEWLASTVEGAKIAELYVGGGTPTVNVYALAEYLDHVRSHFGRSILISVEANPRDVDDEAVSILRSAGVSRLSIGVQALDPRRLVELGRFNNTVEDSLRAVEAARGRFETLNIDMVWGVRGDNPERVYCEAVNALELGASQVTFYPLMPAPGLRRLERMRREGPWHPLDAEMYEAILRAALERGYHPATAWCMDRGSRLIDEYVVDYDRFLALGVSGIGRLGGYAYVNTFSVERYVKLVSERGHSAVLGGWVGRLSDTLYKLSTKAFGLRWPPSSFEDYDAAGRFFEKLGSLVLRLSGGRWSQGRIEATAAGGLYVVHCMQRSLYMAVNMLREWGMKMQV